MALTIILTGKIQTIQIIQAILASQVLPMAAHNLRSRQTQALPTLLQISSRVLTLTLRLLAMALITIPMRRRHQAQGQTLIHRHQAQGQTLIHRHQAQEGTIRRLAPRLLAAISHLTIPTLRHS